MLAVDEQNFGRHADIISVVAWVAHPRGLRFAEHLATRLVVTLGERGAALVGSDGLVTTIPAPRVDAVDTTGAGDAFVGAFAYGLASGWDEVAAVRLGCAIAAESVMRPGTQSSFPDPQPAHLLDGQGARRPPRSAA